MLHVHVNYKEQWIAEDIFNTGFSLPAWSRTCTYPYLLKCRTKKPRWARNGNCRNLGELKKPDLKRQRAGQFSWLLKA